MYLSTVGSHLSGFHAEEGEGHTGIPPSVLYRLSELFQLSKHLLVPACSDKWHLKYCSLTKERPPPTFGPISCIGPEITRMSTYPGESFAWRELRVAKRSALVEFEKHNLKCYAYLR